MYSNILGGLVPVVQNGLARQDPERVVDTVCEPGIYSSIGSRYGYRTSRAVGCDMQATVGGIIDPRPGLSTAPLPLSSIISQTVSNVQCPCSHAAMQPCHGLLAP